MSYARTAMRTGVASVAVLIALGAPAAARADKVIEAQVVWKFDAP